MRIRAQHIHSPGLAPKPGNEEDAMFVPDYRPEYIFSYTVQTRLPPEMIGPTPEGIRVDFYVTGGDVDGPKLKGKFAPFGGDWRWIRAAQRRCRSAIP
jgi:hypothetical protein